MQQQFEPIPYTSPKMVGPWIIQGRIEHGMKRGSTLLGTPTANLAHESCIELLNVAEDGVYAGIAALHVPDNGLMKYMCVISIGTNPQFESGIERIVEVRFPFSYSSFLKCSLSCIHHILEMFTFLYSSHSLYYSHHAWVFTRTGSYHQRFPRAYILRKYAARQDHGIH